MFRACVETVVIETALFYLCGYRDRYSAEIVVFANVITNLSMNLLRLLFPVLRGPLTALLECVVVLAEYFIYADSFGRSKRLFFLTLAANVLSVSLGFIIHYFI